MTTEARPEQIVSPRASEDDAAAVTPELLAAERRSALQRHIARFTLYREVYQSLVATGDPIAAHFAAEIRGHVVPELREAEQLAPDGYTPLDTHLPEPHHPPQTSTHLRIEHGQVVEFRPGTAA